MLNLDRHVISERRELTIHPLNDAHPMCGTVEEIRIAKSNVLGSSFYLLSYISDDDVSRNHAEGPVIDRHDWTVPAQMLAAAARFRVASDATCFAIKHAGVTGERRQP